MLHQSNLKVASMVTPDRFQFFGTYDSHDAYIETDIVS